jgi:protein-S-isoprenylcysteine O-methyltransferase Ste14
MSPYSLRREIWLDILERAIILALYGWLTGRAFLAFAETQGIMPLLVLLSEGTVVAFVLVRRLSANVSTRSLDWFAALVATSAPLLVDLRGGVSVAPQAVCILLLIAGMLFQIWAKLTLRRSFGLVPANRGIKAGGPYRLVRHPMYAGYLLTHVAVLLFAPTLWNATIYAIALPFQLLRILNEERFLGDDEAYRQFAASVQYRLVPKVF